MILLTISLLVTCLAPRTLESSRFCPWNRFDKWRWFLQKFSTQSKAKNNNNKFEYDTNYLVTAIFMFNSKIKKKLSTSISSFLVHAKTSSNLRFIVFFCTFMYKRNQKIEEKNKKTNAKQQQLQKFATQWEIVNVNLAKNCLR